LICPFAFTVFFYGLGSPPIFELSLSFEFDFGAVNLETTFPLLARFGAGGRELVGVAAFLTPVLDFEETNFLLFLFDERVETLPDTEFARSLREVLFFITEELAEASSLTLALSLARSFEIKDSFRALVPPKTLLELDWGLWDWTREEGVANLLIRLACFCFASASLAMIFCSFSSPRSFCVVSFGFSIWMGDFYNSLAMDPAVRETEVGKSLCLSVTFLIYLNLSLEIWDGTSTLFTNRCPLLEAEWFSSFGL
jgi:hypothetical protein